MIEHYVVAKEKRLYAVSLIFSILIWLLLAIAIGAGVFAATGAGTKSATSEISDQSFQETTDSETEETASDFEETELYDEMEYDESMMADSFDEDTSAYTDMDYATPKSSVSEWGMVAVVFGLYIFFIIFIILFSHILAVGHLMGNGVRVTEKQFPELWASFVKAAKALDIKKLPSFYLVESGGMLNAFATRLFTRNYVALYADVAELAYEGDEDTVSFVITHELIHVKRNHMIKGLIILPAAMIPFLRKAWQRACEYSCDAGAAIHEPKGAVKGLSLLAAGKKLSSKINIDAYLESFQAEKSIWKGLAELFASHPHLPKRINAIRNRK